MTILQPIMSMIRFIPTFWDYILNFFLYLPLPEPMLNFLDPTHGSTFKFWVTVIIYFGIYVAISIFVSKLSFRLLGAANNHMWEYGFSIGFNKWLNIPAIILLVFDGLVMASYVAASEDGTVAFSFFSLIAVLLLFIGIIRALIRVKLRAFYMIPMQLLFMLWLYFMVLVWFPALLIMAAIAFFGTAMTSGGGICKNCGYTRANCRCIRRRGYS